MLSVVEVTKETLNDDSVSVDVNLTLALRTLRLSKTNLYGPDEVVQGKHRRTIALLEVGNHDSMGDCWIVLYDRVYDVTRFLDSHPGGMDVILEYAGRDASMAFRGHPKIAILSLKQFEIGELPEKERIYRCEGLLRDEIPE